MTRGAVILLALAPFASACAENDHLGNDREAWLDPPPRAAEIVPAREALDGVATEILYPEEMTGPDLRAIASDAESCAFRFSRLGFPVLVHGSTAAVIKLNGKLIPLAAGGTGVYGDEPVQVSVRPLAEEGAEEPFPAELVLRFQDSPNELGFHGFSGC